MTIMVCKLYPNNAVLKIQDKIRLQIFKNNVLHCILQRTPRQTLSSPNGS